MGLALYIFALIHSQPCACHLAETGTWGGRKNLTELQTERPLSFLQTAAATPRQAWQISIIEADRTDVPDILPRVKRLFTASVLSSSKKFDEQLNNQSHLNGLLEMQTSLGSGVKDIVENTVRIAELKQSISSKIPYAITDPKPFISRLGGGSIRAP